MQFMPHDELELIITNGDDIMKATRIKLLFCFFSFSITVAAMEETDFSKIELYAVKDEVFYPLGEMDPDFVRALLRYNLAQYDNILQNKIPLSTSENLQEQTNEFTNFNGDNISPLEMMYEDLQARLPDAPEQKRVKKSCRVKATLSADEIKTNGTDSEKEIYEKTYNALVDCNVIESQITCENTPWLKEDPANPIDLAKLLALNNISEVISIDLSGLDLRGSGEHWAELIKQNTYIWGLNFNGVKFNEEDIVKIFESLKSNLYITDFSLINHEIAIPTNEIKQHEIKPDVKAFIDLITYNKKILNLKYKNNLNEHNIRHIINNIYNLCNHRYCFTVKTVDLFIIDHPSDDSIRGLINIIGTRNLKVNLVTEKRNTGKLLNKRSSAVIGQRRTLINNAATPNQLQRSQSHNPASKIDVQTPAQAKTDRLKKRNSAFRPGEKRIF